MKTYIICIVLAFITHFSFAQKNDPAVRGIVLAAVDESPLPGVNIVIAGTTLGIVTDADGRFNFPMGIKTGDKLVFSYLSYETQTYEVKGVANEEVIIRLKDDAIMITDEIASNEMYSPKGHRGVFKFLRKAM